LVEWLEMMSDADRQNAPQSSLNISPEGTSNISPQFIRGAGWDAPDEIARTFVRANALNSEIALGQLDTQLEPDLYGDKLGAE
jgi:hypothetical protein